MVLEGKTKMNNFAKRIRKLSSGKPVRKTSKCEQQEVKNEPRRRRSSSSKAQQYVNCGTIKIMVLGDTNVGKTSVCQRYIGNDLTVIENDNIYDTGVYLNIAGDLKQYDLEIYDNSKIDMKSYREKIFSSDGYVLVYSQTNRRSFMKVIETISDIHRLKPRNETSIIILGNKSDEALSDTPLSDVVMSQYDHFSVSALNDDGIHPSFGRLVSMCVEKKIGKEAYDKRKVSIQYSV